jgi:uncharacterized protein with FMN-binding domain
VGFTRRSVDDMRNRHQRTRLLHRRRSAVAVAGLAASAAIVACSTTITDPDSPRPSAGPSGIATSYADGEYSAVGEYGGLPSHITVSLTLADEVITAVAVDTHATDPTSLDYQERFADAVPSVVVGRPIEGLEVSRIAGSSGTPQGFNDALIQIREQASE